jgi:hypothetical protein
MKTATRPVQRLARFHQEPGGMAHCTVAATIDVTMSSDKAS